MPAPQSTAQAAAVDPDEHLCPDCLENMNDPDHYGCSFCGGCECQGAC